MAQRVRSLGKAARSRNPHVKPALTNSGVVSSLRLSVRLFSAPLGVATTDIVSGHPDAIRRRKEREAERLRREQERAEQRAKEEQGLRWWQCPQRPNNMVIATCATQLKDLVRTANAEDKLVVINYFNEDCYACRTLHPKIKKIAADNPDVLFVKANGSVPSVRPVFEALGVDRVPLFHFVRDGEIRCTMTCSSSPERLQLLRAEIACNKASARHPVVPPMPEADNRREYQ